MTPRLALMLALAGITVLPAFESLPVRLPLLEMQSLRHERLAQSRRQDDVRSDPSVPGGLPGAADRSGNSARTMHRGITTRGVTPKADKRKAKSGEDAKKDQQ